MKVTLISPFPEISCFGIRSIAGYLERHKIETQIIFLPDPESEIKAKKDEVFFYNKAILNDIIDHCQGSDIVGMSLFSNNIKHAIELTRALKTGFNGPIVWGGETPIGNA